MASRPEAPPVRPEITPEVPAAPCTSGATSSGVQRPPLTPVLRWALMAHRQGSCVAAR